MINAGSIRASIDPGEISVAEVYAAFPFGNSISTFEVTGQTFLDVLEHAVSVAESPDNDGTGRFLQIAGMRFVWDPERPAGGRIVSAEAGDPERGFTALDPESMYKVATNNYVRLGGDGYDMLAEDAIAPYDFGMLLIDAMIGYIEEYSPVSQATDGRILRNVDGQLFKSKFTCRP